MNKKPVETRFEILGEGGSIRISSVHKGDNDGYDYFLETSEFAFADEELNVYNRVNYETFYEAFDELRKKYAWTKLHLEYCDPDFAEYVADALVEDLNETAEMFRVINKKSFEKALNISLRTRRISQRADWYDIEVKSLTKVTDYEWQEFTDSYAAEIGQKFKLLQKLETWRSDASAETDDFDFTGTVKVEGNSILLLDIDGGISYILPADKFKISCTEITLTENNWHWKKAQ